jgi:DNA-binding NtrC family response regulator
MLLLLDRIISEKTPYEVVTTNNPLEVPELLQQSEFDLIITDLKMPGLDGMDILRLVKDQERVEEVIIITAFGSLESAIEALGQGVFDYITKPFRKEQILFTVDRAMRWQVVRREVAGMRAILDLEPYDQAQQAFQREYVRRLSQRHGGNRQVMAERSGLPEAAIVEATPTEPA